MASKPPPPNRTPALLLAAIIVGAVAVSLRPGAPEATSRSPVFFENPAPSAPAIVQAASTSPAAVAAKTAMPLPAPTPRVQTPPLPAEFSAYPVVARDELAGAEPGEIEQRRIVRAPLKFPLLRIRSVVRDQVVVAEEAVVADQLLVTPWLGVAPAAVASALAAEGIRIRETMNGSGTLLLQLPDHELDSVDRAAARLAARADLFQSVGANGIGFGAAPNDPNFSSQWALQNTGQVFAFVTGTVGVDINASGLWSIVSSAPKVIVAVLDSGMDFTHPDLAGVAWTNTGEIDGNGIDDDGNGRVDDVHGWDFANSDNLPADDHNHGSHVTGIIAARRNNGIGVTGIADPAMILPVKILNSSNTGFTSDLIAALDYARLLGARVMNLSLQNYPNDASLKLAFDRAEAAGIVICIAAGNQGVNNDATPNYPSGFPNANIIAVGNHDRVDARNTGSFASNYGAASVDLFAPGRDVLSTVRNGGYVVFTGTSMACPHVTAIAAIVRALNPTWTAAEVKTDILATAVPRPAYSGICVTGGRLNAEAAISRAIKLMPAGDPDGDGQPSLVEYALGTDPLIGNANGFPDMELNGGMLEFSYNHARGDVSYSVEASDDFVTWDAGIVDQGGSGASITATAPMGILGQRFLRLKIAPQP